MSLLSHGKLSVAATTEQCSGRGCFHKNVLVIQFKCTLTVPNCNTSCPKLLDTVYEADLEPLDSHIKRPSVVTSGDFRLMRIQLKITWEKNESC